MTISISGNGGITFPDGTTLGASGVNAQFTPYITSNGSTTTVYDASFGNSGVTTPAGNTPTGAFIFNATVSANTTNYNVKSAAISAGWDQVKPLVATVTINSGVYVGSTSTGSYGFDTGVTFPAGSSLSLINNGFIVGMGGGGGSGGACGPFENAAYYWGSSGGSGGPALRAQAPISITNNGTIGGGGGGGGGGGSSVYYDGSYNNCFGGGGGGGRGLNGGSAGPVSSVVGPNSPNIYLYGGSSGSGSASSAGGGGGGGYYSGATYGGSGGSGGGLGSTGGTGGNGYGGGMVQGYGAGGGGGGAAVAGNSNITWVATGTRLGAIA